MTNLTHNSFLRIYKIFIKYLLILGLLNIEPPCSHRVAAATMAAQPSGKACDFSFWWLTECGAAMVVGSRCKKTFK
jgi:hypothetical protein